MVQSLNIAGYDIVSSDAVFSTDDGVFHGLDVEKAYWTLDPHCLPDAGFDILELRKMF
jgi:hypothetical protein